MRKNDERHVIQWPNR